VALLEAVVADLDDVVADRGGDVGRLDGECAAEVVLELEAAAGLLRDSLDDLLEDFGGRQRRGRDVGVDRPAHSALGAQHGGRGERGRSESRDGPTTCNHSVLPLKQNTSAGSNSSPFKWGGVSVLR